MAREKTGGRQRGTPNKLTAENGKRLSDIAKQYEEEAIATLAEIMRDRDAPHAARATAANHILDRARGKPIQSMEHSGKDGGDIAIVARIERVVVRPHAKD